MQNTSNQSSAMTGQGLLQKPETSSSSLKKKGTVFFCLAFLLTLLMVGGGLYNVPNRYLIGPALLMIATLGGGLFFYQRKIIASLEEVESRVLHMSGGNFDKQVHVQAEDEIGRVGGRINDLAMNMQEVLLTLWNHSQENNRLLDRIDNNIAEQQKKGALPEVLSNDLAELRLYNESLREIVRSFNYFEVKLEDDKMISDYDGEDLDKAS
ncbi:MAG: HAMP domain-containing protein [Thermodesulfobacteriota bacterium]